MVVSSLLENRTRKYHIETLEVIKHRVHIIKRPAEVLKIIVYSFREISKHHLYTQQESRSYNTCLIPHTPKCRSHP